MEHYHKQTTVTNLKIARNNATSNTATSNKETLQQAISHKETATSNKEHCNNQQATSKKQKVALQQTRRNMQKATSNKEQCNKQQALNIFVNIEIFVLDYVYINRIQLKCFGH